MTFGLWARRATRLLHSAILWCRKPGSNRYEKLISRDFKSRASANSAIPANYDRAFPTSPLYYITVASKSQYLLSLFSKKYVFRLDISVKMWYHITGKSEAYRLHVIILCVFCPIYSSGFEYGEVLKRLKSSVLKTDSRVTPERGFESHPLRHKITITPLGVIDILFWVRVGSNSRTKFYGTAFLCSCLQLRESPPSPIFLYTYLQN